MGEMLFWLACVAVLYAGWRALQITGWAKAGRRLFFVASGDPGDLVAKIAAAIAEASQGEFEVFRVDAARGRLVLHDAHSPLYWYPIWFYDLGGGNTLARVAVTSVWPVSASESHERCHSLLKSILLRKGAAGTRPEVLVSPLEQG